jgi:hypothetical protein
LHLGITRQRAARLGDTGAFFPDRRDLRPGGRNEEGNTPDEQTKDHRKRDEP